jgi:FAD/FMN-containing dehydrogenase
MATHTLTFPAGVCPTIGIGGHLSGGGFDMLMCRYDLASDNILDTLLLDADSRLLNRSTMGG